MSRDLGQCCFGAEMHVWWSTLRDLPRVAANLSKNSHFEKNLQYLEKKTKFTPHYDLRAVCCTGFLLRFTFFPRTVLKGSIFSYSLHFTQFIPYFSYCDIVITYSSCFFCCYSLYLLQFIPCTFFLTQAIPYSFYIFWPLYSTLFNPPPLWFVYLPSYHL